MNSAGHLVMEIEVITGGPGPIHGQARASGVPPSGFSRWAELFPVLQILGSDDGTAHSTSR
ncbi:MAG: hypothetical protein ABSA93_20810 [Streptosporangiaceae bacterium]|jgi:hypothetical protein